MQVNSSLKSFDSILDDSAADKVLVSLRQFKQLFPLQGDDLYAWLFETHPECIKTQKQSVAIANLRQIFEAVFKISAKTGFQKMSLRDLAKQTGMSLGAIYSSISSKEDIVLMVKSVVEESYRLTRDQAFHYENSHTRLFSTIRFHLLASTCLQPWYFFLYFETRSLAEKQQQQSKKIEQNAIADLAAFIQQGVKDGEFSSSSPQAVANVILLLLQDWYLKPWKLEQTGSLDTRLDAYFLQTRQIVETLLSSR